MDFRIREETAGAVLKEVACLEPAERLEEAAALVEILGQAVQGLEELWGEAREPLQRGISPSDAATLGQILARSANLIGSSLDLVRDVPALEKFRELSTSRLDRIKAQAASLRLLVALPAPVSNSERLGRSLEQAARGEGLDAEEFLAELKG
jgi:hypothetical protein